MTNDDPPLLRLSLLAGLILFMGISTYQPVEFETFTKPTTSVSVEAIPNDQLVVINGNSILGLGSPTSNEEVLASLTGIPLLDKIIKAESSNRWWIKNPHSTAYGYCQITKDTRIDAEKALGKINWKDPKQQIKACIWLYKTRGTRPWNDSKSKWAK